MGPTGLDRLAKWRIGAVQPVLADHLIEAPGPHPGCERRPGADLRNPGLLRLTGVE